MGLMHNLFRKINENIHRRRSQRTRPRSGNLSNIEPLEPRIALTATVYGNEQGGDTPGFISIVIDESGEDLFLRQTLLTTGDGLDPRPAIEYADNPSFRAGDEVFFATNDLNITDSFQDVFVTQGIRNSFITTVPTTSSSPDIFLPAADQIDTVDGVAQGATLPPGLTADTTYHMVPGTLGGSRGLNNFRASSATIGFPNQPSIATIYFDTQFITDESDDTVEAGIQDIQLVFSSGVDRTPSELETQVRLNNGGGPVDVFVSGYADPNSGRVQFFYRDSNGPVALDTIYDVNYASPVIADQPSTVTLASGLDLDAGFIVDLPSDDSTITINSPINFPTRGTGVGGADEGVIDLRATNVVINAPVSANDSARFLTSRFHRSPSVTTFLTEPSFNTNTIVVDNATGIEVGAIVVVGNDSGLSFVPNDTNVVAVDVGTNTITLSHPVSLDTGFLSGSGFNLAEFYNPASVLPAVGPGVTATDTVVNSSTIFLNPATLAGGVTSFNLQPGAIIQSQGAPNTPTNIPLNTFVAAVNTTTGRVDFTRPISVLDTDPLTFFNPANLDTAVERFRATAPIRAESYNFDVREDLSTSVNTRGSLYVAGSSGLLGTNGGSANRLTISTGMTDITFEGNVNATTQSYFFQTSVAETPYSFTTKNSSGVPTGSISGTTADITLANLSPASEDDSVVQIVDLDTAVDSLRLSAAFDDQLNPPYVEDDPYGPFPFAITVREQDALSLDAALSSGGPVEFTVGGDLALTATIQSQNDLSFTSVGTMTGTAWLTTANGSIDLEATDVNISGLTQVLTAPFDPNLTDVTVTATNGSVQLGQGIRAVNKVVIDQRTLAAPAGVGSVSSNGLIAANDVRIFSQGDVTIDTASPNVNVSVAGQVTNAQGTVNLNIPRIVTVDSAVPASFELSSAGGTVNVSALGVDPVLPVPDPVNPGSFIGGVGALTLSLRDTNVLFATAPQGSVDVTAVTSQDLVIGVAADLLTGQAANMQAAGSVSVRTTQAPVTVLDAAIAGQGQLQVRAAATGNLQGDYSFNTPGITPTTITGQGNGSINGAVPLASFGGLAAETNPLRFRDLVLLSNQDNAVENGVYQVIKLGNQSEPWQLRRYGLADTTAELPARSRIYVRDGDAAGQTYKVDSYTNNSAAGTTPLLVTQGYERAADEIAVRFATEAILDGSYDAGAKTITANPANVSGFNVNETPVNVGDLILVQFGAELGGGGNNTTTSAAANGVYEVTAAGNAWQLTRYENPEPPAVPPATITTFEATVVVLEGFYRTSRSGETFTVAFDGMGLVPLVISQDDSVSSEIGSYDPRDVTTLVVSTAAGTNDAAGSFGKMLTLAQDNAAADLVGQALVQELEFGNELGSVTGATGTIVLQQELPKIQKPIIVDASSRFPLSNNTAQTVVVDGSRITSSSEGTFVGREDEVNGLELVAEASAELSNPFRPLESTVSSLRFGGFRQGAAIYVNGASNVLLDNLTIGQNENGDTQAVRYGVRVSDTSGRPGDPSGVVSIVGGQITSAMTTRNNLLAPNVGDVTVPDGVAEVLDGAGVLLESNPLTGETASNVRIVGTQIGSQTAGNLVGVVSRSSNTSADLNSIGVNPIGEFVAPTRLNSRTLTIPATDSSGEAIDIRDIYVGQSVTASSEVDGGTVVVAINLSAREITLSEALIASNTEAKITLGTPGRTTIGQNFWGVLLESGATRLVNTDVVNNVYDGVFIGDGAANAVFAMIGASTEADSTSNAIYSNGRNGIRFATNLTSAIGITDINIQGNYVGRSTSNTSFVGNDQGSYFWQGNGIPLGEPGSTAFASFGYDPATNTPTPPSYITVNPTTNLFKKLITPAISGGDVDENGNVNADFVAGSTGGGTIQPPGPPPPDDGNT